MKTVAKKLLQVIESIDGKVAKSGYNAYSKYKYVTESDLIDAIRPALIKHGLMVTTSVESYNETAATEDDDNRYASLTLEHTIIDVDTGDFIKVKSVGTGADRLDKSIYKSYTGAFKYFILKNFLLSGDDDPENEGGSDQKKGGGFGKSSSAPAKSEAPAPAKTAAKSSGLGMMAKKTGVTKAEEPEKEEAPKPQAAKWGASANKTKFASKPKEPEPEEVDGEEVDDGDENDPAF